MSDINAIVLPEVNRDPDFGEFLKVLRREVPSRPVLYELYINNTLYSAAAGEQFHDDMPMLEQAGLIARAFKRLGYDYANPWRVSDFRFPTGEKLRAESISQNEGAVITDRESFKSYSWPDPKKSFYLGDDELQGVLPDGMKFLTFGAGGILESALSLVGFENLCIMMMDDPDLLGEIFDHIGERVVEFYRILSGYESIGALVLTDDWGFKSQTVLPPAQMRSYIFPWHRKIVEVIHEGGKPAILHSCGNLQEVMDDVIDEIGYDARHSYEDAIIPVEDAYERWGGRIAVLGGIDVDFLCHAAPEEIRDRCRAMLKRTSETGGYALGTGNSVPEYVPVENYLAMISAALEY